MWEACVKVAYLAKGGESSPRSSSPLVDVTMPRRLNANIAGTGVLYITLLVKSAVADSSGAPYPHEVGMPTAAYMNGSESTLLPSGLAND